MNITRQLKQYLLKLDIFSNDTQNDEFENRIGRIATRIFFLLFIFLFLIYILFNTLSIKTVSETIYHPTQDQYEHLQARYPETLVCPCRNIAIHHESFISLIPTFHPICLSGFVTDAWILYTINTVDRSSIITVSCNPINSILSG